MKIRSRSTRTTIAAVSVGALALFGCDDGVDDGLDDGLGDDTGVEEPDDLEDGDTVDSDEDADLPNDDATMDDGLDDDDEV